MDKLQQQVSAKKASLKKANIVVNELKSKSKVNVFLYNLKSFIRSLFNFKEIRKRNLFKVLYKPIKYRINTRWNTIHFNKLKRKAVKLHKATGKQYFIVPTPGQYCMVVDSHWRKNIYNKNVKKDQRLNTEQFLNMVYFMTAQGTNSIK